MNLRERYKYDRVVQELLDQVGYGVGTKLRNRLNYWRHQKLMEQKEFAEWLGVGLSTYNRWERQVAQPNIESAWIISKKLGIHMEELFEEWEE